MNANITLRPSNTRVRSSAALAIAGSMMVLALLGGLHALSQEFDPSFRMISEYTLGQHAWVLSLMFLVWGFSTWALALAIWKDAATPTGRIGLRLLVVAGLGEILASMFDVTHELGHGIAGLLGVVGLPVAAVLVSGSLDRTRVWANTGKALRRCSAHFTWIAVLFMIAAMVAMTVQFLHVNGGHLPEHAPKVLPPGVIGLAGWADRLIVVANCLWVTVVAWQAILVVRAGQQAQHAAAA